MSINGGTPKWLVCNGESMKIRWKLMIWRCGYFRKPPNLESTARFEDWRLLSAEKCWWNSQLLMVSSQKTWKAPILVRFSNPIQLERYTIHKSSSHRPKSFNTHRKPSDPLHPYCQPSLLNGRRDRMVPLMETRWRAAGRNQQARQGRAPQTWTRSC